MYKYLVTANIEKETGSAFANFYYEINFKLDCSENIEKIIDDIKEQSESSSVTIMFIMELD